MRTQLLPQHLHITIYISYASFASLDSPLLALNHHNPMPTISVYLSQISSILNQMHGRTAVEMNNTSIALLRGGPCTGLYIIEGTR